MDGLIRTGAYGRRGFTLIELTVVVMVSAIILTLAGLSFSRYFQRNSARRAAQVFAQDLTAARSFAVRSQEAVVIRFFETSLWYEVESQTTATEIARRRFGTDADIDLSGVDLNVAGDSLVFSPRGIADMSGAGGSVGTASFSSGAVTYTVSFNGMGASKIDQT
ncbi:MAG: GspH/FimT family pseudopilin [Gemmatimonadetes bacterium]|nr:GspH/FimT family pseudopilin [Gemmatimonadota bacterium]MDA1102515.1 GspH/FimT family pseudopilin [Gemmatimonadota bacterium]